MKKVIIEDINKLEIYTSNEEKMVFPAKAINDFKYDENNNFELKLILSEDIIYRPIVIQNPLDRLYTYNDIVNIKCILTDGSNIEIIPGWKESNNPYVIADENKYQTATRETLSDIHIIVFNNGYKEENDTYLEELILDEFEAKYSGLNELQIETNLVSLSEITEDGLYKDIHSGDKISVIGGEIVGLNLTMINSVFERIEGEN